MFALIHFPQKLKPVIVQNLFCHSLREWSNLSEQILLPENSHGRTLSIHQRKVCCSVLNLQLKIQIKSVCGVLEECLGVIRKVDVLIRKILDVPLYPKKEKRGNKIPAWI
jgi:hypothetical protein